MELPWAKTKEECLKYFNVDEEKGLSDDQVVKLQEKYGPNGNLSQLIFKMSQL